MFLTRVRERESKRKVPREKIDHATLIVFCFVFFFLLFRANEFSPQLPLSPQLPSIFFSLGESPCRFRKVLAFFFFFSCQLPRAFSSS
jgi:hypothetical protein